MFDKLRLLPHVDIKGLGAELSHRLVIEHFHVLAAWSDPGRAFLEPVQVHGSHLLYIYEGLAVCGALRPRWALRCARMVCFVQTLNLIQLLLIEIG